jgi:hypothetical protein
VAVQKSPVLFQMPLDLRDGLHVIEQNDKHD